MTNRMTDERLAVRIAAIEPYKDRPDFEDEWELLQALKAERKSLNDCARDNTKFRQRIRELGEALAEWVADGKAMEQRIREMKKQVVNMNRHITDLQDDKRLLNDRISKLEAQHLRRTKLTDRVILERDELKAKLERVGKLPKKWREDREEQRSVGCRHWQEAEYYADELDEVLADDE